MARRVAAAIIGALTIACGARTGLSLERPDGSVDGAAPCLRDFECADAFDCTIDRCERGACAHDVDHTRCDDGTFCDGDERCDVALGCVEGARSCGDGVSCTEDVCVEARATCEHEPLSRLCPISHRCDPERGCVARALVHTPDALYDVDLPSGETHFITATELSLTDIALHPDGRLFAVNFSTLFRMDPETGALTFLLELGGAMRALDFGPDGFLYAAGSTTITRVDVDHGTVDPIASFPPGWSASGDIAFVEGRFLVTAVSSSLPGDWLFEVPLAGGVAREIGAIGSTCIWGVAPFGATLYGLTCQGELVEIDVATGAGMLLADDLGIDVNGAAAR